MEYKTKLQSYTTISEKKSQYIPLHFDFIESPLFHELSGYELKTYLMMRRYVCRAESGHYLSQYYQDGNLAFQMSQANIAKRLNTTQPTIGAAITVLIEKEIIKEALPSNRKYPAVYSLGTVSDDGSEHFFIDVAIEKSLSDKRDYTNEDDINELMTSDKPTNNQSKTSLYYNKEALNKENNNSDAKITSPKSIDKSNSRSKHPAIIIYRKETNYFPNKSLFDDIITTVGNSEENLLFWEKLLHCYIGMGWNPKNIKNQLEFFRRKELPTNKVFHRQKKQGFIENSLESFALYDKIMEKKNGNRSDNQGNPTRVLGALPELATGHATKSGADNSVDGRPK